MPIITTNDISNTTGKAIIRITTNNIGNRTGEVKIRQHIVIQKIEVAPQIMIWINNTTIGAPIIIRTRHNKPIHIIGQPTQIRGQSTHTNKIADGIPIKIVTNIPYSGTPILAGIITNKVNKIKKTISKTI